MMILQQFFLWTLLLMQTLHLNGMMRDMAIMMGAQLGASIADQTVSNMYQQVAKGIQADQTNMSIASNSFLQNVQQAQEGQLKNMVNLFSSAGAQVETLMTNQTTNMQQMQNYIESIVSLQTPTPEYLSYGTEWDQTFANATMYTPQGRVWKNIFQVGNWQYDETTNSFWQMQQEPFITPASTSTSESTTAPINNAYQNSIFTEWTTQQPYEISCDITLYQVTYPFFAGIIFNRTRWISGDSYGLQKYRTLGIYGNENKQISLCYAEQTVPTSPTTATTMPMPNFPLDQIQSGQGAQKTILNQASFQNLQLQPLTMHFKIKPAPTSVEYKVWPNDGTAEPQSYIMIKTNSAQPKTSKKTTKNKVVVPTGGLNYTYSVVNGALTVTSTGGSTYTYNIVNDSDMYLYHGVGFLSPGAIAQFQLKGPNQLLFNSTQIQTFTQDFATYVKEQQTQLATKQIDSIQLNPISAATLSARG